MAHKFNLEHAERLEQPDRLALFHPDVFRRQVTLPPAPVLADIGTGTGFYLPILSRWAGPAGMVWALDTQSEAVERARQKVRDLGLTNVEVVASGESELPLPDDSVDFALLAFVFHELERPEELLAELRRVVRADGRLGLVEWTKAERDKGPPPSEIPDPELMRAMFARQGWRERWAETSGNYCHLYLFGLESSKGAMNPE